MSSAPHFNEIDILQSICRESFFDFVQQFWSVIIPEKPVWNWHIEYLCDELQTVAERVFDNQPKEYDLLINIPPGTTKSTICSIMYPAWIWTRMPTARVLSASFEFMLALTFSRKSRTIVTDPRYQQAFLDEKGNPIILRLDQNTKQQYENTRGGERKAVGAGGNITGSHGHFIIVDDPLNPREAVSAASLKDINRWMDETLPSRKVDKEVTPTILIMQRLHQDDPAGHWLDKNKRNESRIRHVCLPAELQDNVRPRTVRRYYSRGLLDPVRLSKKVLEEARLDLGEFGYAGQFDQSPVPLGGGLFKWELLLDRIAVPPAKWAERVRYWDKAGTHKGGAYTVGTLMGKDLKGRFWVLDVVRGQWNSAAREAIIKATAKIDGPDVVIGVEQEPGSGGMESAQSTVINLAGYRVRVNKPTGDKVLRADPFSVQVNNGSVYLVNGEWITAWLDEIKHFPYSRYMDQVDSASGAFAELTKVKFTAGGLGAGSREG